MTGNELIERLNWRYAVKKFDSSKKISDSDWKSLEEAAILTPSSYGMQPWKFLIIQNKEVRKQLTPASWNQPQVEDCSHFMVLCAKTSISAEDVSEWMDCIATTRGVEKSSLDGFGGMIAKDIIDGPRSKMIPEWATRQTYIALGNLMTCAANLGIDACPMEGIEYDKYDDILKLKEQNLTTAVALAFGYRSDEDFLAKAKKARFNSEKVIKHI